MDISMQMKKAALRTAMGYIEKNPENNMLKLMDWVDKLAGDGPDSFPAQRAAFRNVLNEPGCGMHQLILNVLRDVDNSVIRTAFENFFLNACLIGWPRQEQYREKLGCSIPWAILMDPTSACNLRCTGCWAAEYGNKLNLTYNELSGIIRQGKELGTYMYIFSGGEPLVRKQDILRLCEEHSDCQFLAFTNATLIDEEFAREMLRVRNFIPAISVEGFEEATDRRRGTGTYQAIMQAMAILKECRLPFGASCCYTSQNVASITCDFSIAAPVIQPFLRLHAVWSINAEGQVKLVLDGTEYQVGHTKEYIRAAVRADEDLTNRIVSARIEGLLGERLCLASLQI